jgi:hypothetical protein
MPHKEQGSMRVTTQTAAGIVPEGDLSDNLAGLERSRLRLSSRGAGGRTKPR